MDIHRLVDYLTSQSGGLITSVATLTLALLVACGFVLFTRKFRKTRIKSLLRALFSKKIWLSDSARLDFKYVFLNSLIFPVIFGSAILSYQGINTIIYSGLSHVFSTPGPSSLSDTQYRILMTVMLYLAYELAYWTDHYLSHKVRFLWEFHKIHHSASVLTPFTNWRVHPVDSIVFYNIKAITIGITYSIATYVVGKEITMSPESIILLVYMCLYGHLQHSHLWISFTGWTGRIFLSPAHHQIHHSNTPEHFNKNFGASLAIWDWLFGTLYVPSKKKQDLVFGVSNLPNAHILPNSLFTPFRHVGKRIFKRKNVSGFSKLPGEPATESDETKSYSSA